MNVSTLPVARIIECGLPSAAVSLLDQRCLFVDGGNRGLCHGLRCLEDAEIFALLVSRLPPSSCAVYFLLEIRNAIRTWEEPYTTHD